MSEVMQHVFGMRISSVGVMLSSCYVWDDVMQGVSVAFYSDTRVKMLELHCNDTISD